MQWQNIKYVIVTDDDVAPQLARALAQDRPAWGKSWGDYQIQTQEQDGTQVLLVPENKLEILQRDALWAHTSLDVSPDHIHIQYVQ